MFVVVNTATVVTRLKMLVFAPDSPLLVLGPPIFGPLLGPPLLGPLLGCLGLALLSPIRFPTVPLSVVCSVAQAVGLFLLPGLVPSRPSRVLHVMANPVQSLPAHLEVPFMQGLVLPSVSRVQLCVDRLQCNVDPVVAQVVLSVLLLVPVRLLVPVSVVVKLLHVDRHPPQSVLAQAVPLPEMRLVPSRLVAPVAHCLIFPTVDLSVVMVVLIPVRAVLRLVVMVPVVVTVLVRVLWSDPA